VTQEFYSNGKLLLTGEYAILDGAVGLALPTTYGQRLQISETDTPDIHWQSYDHNNAVWYAARFNLQSLQRTDATHTKDEIQTTTTLAKLLVEARKLNPLFLSNVKGIAVKAVLDFPLDWGLGSSSTLINCIAQWARVDAYTLLWNAFSGSGYDIACAQHNKAVLYALEAGQPTVTEIDFNPPFKDQLYFVHLNKKQNSRDGIAQYRNRTFDRALLINAISGLTEEFCLCSSLTDFEKLIAGVVILYWPPEGILLQIISTKKGTTLLYPFQK